MVTADAANAQRETAEYIAGNEEDGGRDPTTSCSSRATSPTSSAPSSTRSRRAARPRPDYTELDHGHGRIIRRSIWVTDAEDIDFPHVSAGRADPPRRLRRQRHADQQGDRARRHQPGADQASPADLARLARGQWGIESVHWLRDTAYDEDANTGYAGNGPQAMATLRNLAISLLYLSGVTEITRTLQAIARDRNRVLDYLPL